MGAVSIWSLAGAGEGRGCVRNGVVRTLCFSRIPHLARSAGWARSLWLRRWTAFRMDDIFGSHGDDGGWVWRSVE